MPRLSCRCSKTTRWLTTCLRIVNGPDAGGDVALALIQRNRRNLRVTKSVEENGNANETQRRTPFLRELLLRIQGEYREMPGLSLTLCQAERLWGLDRSTCALALKALVERGVLRKTMNGTYLRGHV